MGSLITKRQQVGDQIAGALEDSTDTVDGVEACADVVRAMVNQLGADENAVIPLWPDDLRGSLTAAEQQARRAAIVELAGRLGLHHALQEIHLRPVPPEDDIRTVLAPDGCELHTAAKTIAIIATLDDNIAVIQYEGHEIAALPGAIPADIVSEAKSLGIS